MKTINCPQCNAQIKPTKSPLLFCPFCSSSFLVEESYAIDDKLIQLNQKFSLRTTIYTPISSTVLKHIDGKRMDWLIEDKDKNQFILMIEDEDSAIIPATKTKIIPKFDWGSMLPNTQIELIEKQWLVTDKRLFNGKIKQVYLGNQNADLLLLTYDNGSCFYQLGQWVDTFEVKRVN